MPAIQGLNHITLAVTDLQRALDFYCGILGAKKTAKWATGAYLDLGGIWLCLAVGPVTPRQDYTHFALSCSGEGFEALAKSIRATSPEWQTNSSQGPSLYFMDPDGHRLELHVGDMQSRLDHYRTHPESNVTLYD
ncbi:Catechol 2,3-dioxygenase [Shimia gijangensis]|uniref:Catechol 2,3-dioxygenase n=1 Tax=Shimia gijangensis TaxID=1470563 RepID=A0A1M6LA41_9RHOB|nr:VOC family protein [Shimia gijangensis]SHJ68066.1 Catechol 2,3-dioxygenase [Shimia gijangensis]